MLRFYIMALRSFFFMPYALFKCTYMNRHEEKYSMEDKYRFVQKIVNYLRRKSRTKTIVEGEENLPESGPYVLFANHQGKYDGLGVVAYHKKPLTIIMEKKKADMIVARQMMPMVKGRPIDLEDPRQQLSVIKGVCDDLKEGRIYLIFPEGGYTDNHNHLQEFRTGVFKCPYEAKCPVVPTVLIDSYKAMEGNKLGKVTTWIYYLKPIMYDEYKDLKRGEFAALVKSRIQEKITEVTGE